MTQKSAGDGFQVSTDETVFEAANVVMATGLFQKPKIPPFSANLSATITQLHSSEYRNPQSLPPGAVLVVGSAQSGCQIAEELHQSGCRVFLCVGSAGRVPRRYRGKDIFWWLDRSGFFNRPPDALPSPRAKFAGNPHVSGKGGGHTLNLHQFARDGVVLLGHVQDAQGNRIMLAPDLHENLRKADKFEADVVKIADEYIAKNGPDVLEERLPELRDGYAAEVIRELDLAAAGIKTVIWAVGYRFDFSLVRLPILDGDGYPLQQRGITRYPGLYFVGLPWLTNQKSGLLLGVGDDAAHIAADIADRHK